jgi:hypothetical protein
VTPAQVFPVTQWLRLQHTGVTTDFELFRPTLARETFLRADEIIFRT